MIFHKIISICILTFFIFSCSNDNPGYPSPFSGITHTLEGGPEPVGEVDPNDWKSIPQVGLVVYPAYPNPTDPFSHLKFTLNQKLFVKVELDDPVNRKIITYDERQLEPGTYQIYIDFNYEPFQRPLDTIVRINIYAEKDGAQYSTYGDIRVIWK